MTSQLHAVDRLIRDLDLVYQSTLDRIESQARDAILMDKAVRHILSHDNAEDSVLKWNPERAISPQGAFRALAHEVIRAAQAGHEESLTPMDYEDLLSWIGEPDPIPGEEVSETLLRRIEFAREQTLARFWRGLSLRISPERNPDAALGNAVNDLVATFAVKTPTTLLIPYRPEAPHRTLLAPIRRTENDIEWTLRDRTLHDMTRAGYALSTVCKLRNEMGAAKAIQELVSSAQSKLKSSFSLYRPNDSFAVGDMVGMNLQQFHVGFRLSPRIWTHVWEVLPERAPGVEFVDSPEKV